jgi:hypothetical protein
MFLEEGLYSNLLTQFLLAQGQMFTLSLFFPNANKFTGSVHNKVLECG